MCLGTKDHLDPEWWDELHKRSSRSAFTERIHWIGQVEDIRPWLRSAFLLLLASDGEPFGRVLVEAMACGVPVIATRSGGIPEVVREGMDGLLASPGNAEELSEGILKLLGDTAFRDRIAESGRERAENFSIENHVHKMVQVFEETLSYYYGHVAQ